MIIKEALAEYTQVKLLLGALSRDFRANALMKPTLDHRDPLMYKYDKLQKRLLDKCVTTNTIALLRSKAACIVPSVSSYSVSAGVPLPEMLHQQKTIPSRGNGCIRVDAVCQSRQRHPSGESLPSRHQYSASLCISPFERRSAVSSCFVSLIIQTNTLALWPTVTIRRNGFIGYTLALGLQCHG